MRDGLIIIGDIRARLVTCIDDENNSKNELNANESPDRLPRGPARRASRPG